VRHARVPDAICKPDACVAPGEGGRFVPYVEAWRVWRGNFTQSSENGPMRVVTSTPSTMAPEPSLHAVPDAADWRRRQPEPRRRALRVWLWSIALMTLLTLVIGGITRLTRSGLSIVDWAPIMGVVPPLSEHAWEEAFAAYRAFPE